MLSKFKADSGRESSYPSGATGQGNFSVIGSDVVVSGNLSSEGDLHIDGCIEGDVTCKRLTLGEGGHVSGAITADDVRISGVVDGPITTRNLVLEKVARIKGDIAYENMSMQAGANVEGQLTHRNNADTGLTLVAAAE